MNNTDKAVKALKMAGMDAGFLNKHGRQGYHVVIRVKGVLFMLHEEEIAKWAETYDKSVATAPLEAAKLIRRSCQALDMGNRFDEKIRDDLKAAMDLLNLYSEPNQAGEGNSPKADDQ